MLQRNIVFHPKDSKSYLYLAKIYKTEENEREEEKNVNTALLLEPNNEEAMYMLIDLKLKRSDYNRVKELTEKFEIICSSFCDKIDLINERLTNIQAKDESWGKYKKTYKKIRIWHDFIHTKLEDSAKTNAEIIHTASINRIHFRYIEK